MPYKYEGGEPAEGDPEQKPLNEENKAEEPKAEEPKAVSEGSIKSLNSVERVKLAV